ncbi:MAG: hypothetical protein GY874_01005 [Desulfobacteraceae bacterium]|nr:hypothetical protein [Desulfobacteraceae bacterium]
MSYTQEDLAAVQNAIIELATVKRMVRLKVAGNEYEFSEANLDSLKLLRSDIQQELGKLPQRGYIRNIRRLEPVKRKRTFGTSMISIVKSALDAYK